MKGNVNKSQTELWNMKQQLLELLYEDTIITAVYFHNIDGGFKICVQNYRNIWRVKNIYFKVYFFLKEWIFKILL